MAHALPFQGSVQVEAAIHASEWLCQAGLLGCLPSLGTLLTWDFLFILAFLQLLLPLSFLLEDQVK